MKTTYIVLANTNQKVFDNANAIANPKHVPNKNIRPFRQYIYNKQEVLLKHVVRSANEDPLRQSTLRFNSPLPFAPSTRRVGRPRANWTWETYKRLYSKHNYRDEQTWKTNPAQAVQSMEADIQNRVIWFHTRSLKLLAHPRRVLTYSLLALYIQYAQNK